MGDLAVVTYGECKVAFLSGSATSQTYAAYGEGNINSLAIDGKSGKITAYGEADFTMNVSDKIQVTAFGEAKLHYTGNPIIRKGIHIGELHVDQMN